MTNPFAEAETFRVAVCDLNGQPRGKRLPIARAEKVMESGLRMPLSALSLDVTGADIEGSPLVFASGDADGIVRATDRGPIPMPWVEAPSVLVPLWMFTEDGRPFPGDPRHALAAVIARYAAYKWAPLVATELEFYLIDRAAPATGPEILSLKTLDTYDAYFTDLYRAADEMGISADAATSEAGPGQFEVNLHHTDAMRAADDAWAFKMLVKGLARRHGLQALFMAKPLADEAGNGLHVHFSVMTDDEENIFSDLRPLGRETLEAAIAGCLATLPASMTVLAPHIPSFTRFTAESHAPTKATWGHENRTTALRVPGGAAFARRIEHRVAGADANPYLLLATILGAALDGIEAETPPPPPVTGNAYEADAPALPTEAQAALSAFESAPEMQRLLPRDLIRHLAMTKRQDFRVTAGLSAAEQQKLYAGLL